MLDKSQSVVSVPSWCMMDDTLSENNNFVSSQHTEEKQSLVKMNTDDSRILETQFDINDAAKDLLNNKVSLVVCSHTL